MYVLSSWFFLPMINALVTVQIHQNSLYNPRDSCTFIRNASLSNDSSIQSCIWECVYEYNCQTAVFYKDEKLCSMFAELWETGTIQSSRSVWASVICYRKTHVPIITCSSSVTSSTEDKETTTIFKAMTSTEQRTTNFDYGSRCLNMTCMNTTTSTMSWIAFYSFDFDTTDATNKYPANGVTSPIYVPGWVGSAISFNAANNQYLSTANIPLDLRSFTIEFWFYTTDVNSFWDFSFMGEFFAENTDQCLFINIRNQKLFFGFFGVDTDGSTTIVINKWYHAAFVYDNNTRHRCIYLNGILDTQSSNNGPLLATSVNFTMGGARIGGNTNRNVYYSGYLDHVTISSQVKPACEIYLDATLACYFTFDSASSAVDSGPNFLPAFNTGGTPVTGRINQALQFSSPLSYISINGISALKSENQIFSISMWVYPTNVTGGATLIHGATQSNGQGTCLTMWGLTLNGTVTVNVIDATNTTISATAPTILSLNTWTHIIQTFSPTNGSRLYLNGMLVANVSTYTGRSVGPYVTIGASPVNTSYCSAGPIVTGQFYGSIDEYRVFGVELTATDICRLAHP